MERVACPKLAGRGGAWGVWHTCRAGRHGWHGAQRNELSPERALYLGDGVEPRGIVRAESPSVGFITSNSCSIIAFHKRN